MKIAIVFGNDHTNSVGVIQSLGKQDINLLVCYLATSLASL